LRGTNWPWINVDGENFFANRMVLLDANKLSRVCVGRWVFTCWVERTSWKIYGQTN
jgi:hypothetical protein